MIAFNWRGMSELQLDLKVLEVIPTEHQSGETALFNSKWWDYRRMHPMAATYQFAECYERAYRRVHRRTVDKDTAETVKVYNVSDPMRDTEKKVLGLWLARRQADTAGIPYDFYCLHALDWSERLAWKKLARPDELTNKALLEKIAEEWESVRTVRLNLPLAPFLANPGFYREPLQRYLCQQIKGRPGGQHLLGVFLKNRYVDEPLAREFFDSSKVDSALAAA